MSRIRSPELSREVRRDMSTPRRVTVVVLTTGLVLAGGVAVASWVTEGTGPATAEATTAQSLVVSPASPTASLYPKPAGGYSSGDVGTVAATVANPNPFPIRLSSATLGTIALTPESGRTCAAGSVVHANGVGTVALTPGVLVAANSSGTVVDIPGALEMVATAEDGCQGVGVSVTVTLTGSAA